MSNDAHHQLALIDVCALLLLLGGMPPSSLEGSDLTVDASPTADLKSH